MATDVISVTMSGTQSEITVRYCHGGATHRLRLSAWEDTETFTVDATKAALSELSVPGATKKELRAAIVSALVCIRPHASSNKITRAIPAQQYAKVQLACCDKNHNKDFCQQGFHCERQAIADQSLLATLLEMHKHLLPHIGAGGAVHSENGARTRTIRLEKNGWTQRMLDHRIGMLNRVTFKMYTSKNDNKKKRWAAAIKTLCAIIGVKAGRPPDSLHEYMDAMLSFPRQTPQSWHMDGLYELTGVIIFLTNGRATEFANYNGKAWMHMTHSKRVAYHTKSWGAVTGATHTPRSAGSMHAGDMLFTNTGHIHRAPPPPTDGYCRTLFVAFETDDTLASGTVVSENNWEALLNKGGSRKRNRTTYPYFPQRQSTSEK